MLFIEGFFEYVETHFSGMGTDWTMCTCINMVILTLLQA